MAKVSMKALLESGVHFGHRTQRWNPNMKPYIFTERNGIHIIDLQQTAQSLNKYFKMVREVVSNGGTVLFVGTKRQAHETIMDEATRCEMPYVTVRWLGGMMTNWNTMRQRILELDRLERMRDEGELELLTKKEGLMMERKIDKLESRFGGIRGMHKLPDLVFIVDIRREETAVKEANTLGIPILALVDTNCDPRNIDHVIPSNDDAIRTIKLMVNHFAEAVLEGKAMRKDDEVSAPPVEAVVEETEELTDEELLGAATLAKMDAQAVADAAAAAKAAEAAESTEEGSEEGKEEGAEEATETTPEYDEATEEKTEDAVEEVPKVEAKPKTKAKTKTKSEEKAADEEPKSEEKEEKA
jgi:small subunit ribosomal protein S2